MSKKVIDLRAARSKKKPLSLDDELKIAARYYFDPVRYKDGAEPQIFASGKTGPDGSFVAAADAGEEAMIDEEGTHEQTKTVPAVE